MNNYPTVCKIGFFLIISLIGCIAFPPTQNVSAENRVITQANIINVSLTDSKGSVRHELGTIVELRDEDGNVIFWYHVLNQKPAINHPQSDDFLTRFEQLTGKTFANAKAFDFMVSNTTIKQLSKNLNDDVLIEEIDKTLSVEQFYEMIFSYDVLVNNIYYTVTGSKSNLDRDMVSLSNINNQLKQIKKELENFAHGMLNFQDEDDLGILTLLKNCVAGYQTSIANLESQKHNELQELSHNFANSMRNIGIEFNWVDDYNSLLGNISSGVRNEIESLKLKMSSPIIPRWLLYSVIVCIFFTLFLVIWFQALKFKELKFLRGEKLNAIARIKNQIGEYKVDPSLSVNIKEEIIDIVRATDSESGNIDSISKQALIDHLNLIFKTNERFLRLICRMDLSYRKKLEGGSDTSEKNERIETGFNILDIAQNLWKFSASTKEQWTEIEKTLLFLTKEIGKIRGFAGKDIDKMAQNLQSTEAKIIKLLKSIDVSEFDTKYVAENIIERSKNRKNDRTNVVIIFYDLLALCQELLDLIEKNPPDEYSQSAYYLRLMQVHFLEVVTTLAQTDVRLSPFLSQEIVNVLTENDMQVTVSDAKEKDAQWINTKICEDLKLFTKYKSFILENMKNSNLHHIITGIKAGLQEIEDLSSEVGTDLKFYGDIIYPKAFANNAKNFVDGYLELFKSKFNSNNPKSSHNLGIRHDMCQMLKDNWEVVFTQCFRSASLMLAYCSNGKKARYEKLMMAYLGVESYLYFFARKHLIKPHVIQLGKTIFDDEIHKELEKNGEESSHINALLSLGRHLDNNAVSNLIEESENEKVIIDVTSWGFDDEGPQKTKQSQVLLARRAKRGTT